MTGSTARVLDNLELGAVGWRGSRQEGKSTLATTKLVHPAELKKGDLVTGGDLFMRPDGVLAVVHKRGKQEGALRKLTLRPEGAGNKKYIQYVNSSAYVRIVNKEEFT